MKLSNWRPALLNWLQKRIQVTSWELRQPTSNDVAVGFVPPLQQTHYVSNGDVMFGYATQDFFVSYLYDSSILYQDLPIAMLEGIHCTLSMALLLDWHAIAPLTNLQLIKLPRAVSVKESGDRIADWVIDIQWSTSLQWVAEPEVELRQPVTLNSIGLNLWQHKLSDPTKLTDWTADKVLDYHFQTSGDALSDGSDILATDNTVLKND